MKIKEKIENLTRQIENIERKQKVLENQKEIYQVKLSNLREISLGEKSDD